MSSPSTPVLLVQDRPVGPSMDVHPGSGSGSGNGKGKGKVSTLGTKLLASTTGAVMTASLSEFFDTSCRTGMRMRMRMADMNRDLVV